MDAKTIPEKLDIIYPILEFTRTEKRKLEEQRVTPNARDLQIHLIHGLVDREEEVCTELEALLDEQDNIKNQLHLDVDSGTKVSSKPKPETSKATDKLKQEKKQIEFENKEFV